MTIFLACLSAAALVASVVAVLYARKAVAAANQSSVAADRSATTAESADRRARTPRLAIIADDPAPAPCDKVIYRVRNDGPQDLHALTIFRPRPAEGITHPIAKTGVTGWADDEVTWGPLKLTAELRFTLCCGAAEKVPEFRVRIECRSGDDNWELNELLPSPRDVSHPVSDYL